MAEPAARTTVVIHAAAERALLPEFLLLSMRPAVQQQQPHPLPEPPSLPSRAVREPAPGRVDGHATPSVPRVHFVPRSRRQLPTALELSEQQRVDEEIARLQSLDAEKSWSLAQFSSLLGAARKRGRVGDEAAGDLCPELSAADEADWKQREVARLFALLDVNS